MTYDEFKDSLIDNRDELCKELFGKEYDDLNEQESAQWGHSVATAWITHKYQSGELE